MSWQASAWALKTRVGDPALKILLLAIANYADPDGECFIRIDTLAYDSEVSARTIQRSLRKLVDLGLITITERFDKNGRQTASGFTLKMGENGGDKTRGDKLTPPDSVTVGVTPNCHGEGDSTVSPSESFERSNELSIERSKTTNAREARLVTAADWPENYADVFWSRYPNKKSKGHALKALDKIAKAGKTRFADLIAGVERYILSRDVQRGFVKHPATWLNGQCWKDEEQSTPIAVGRQQSFMEVAQEAYENANGARTDFDGKW